MSRSYKKTAGWTAKDVFFMRLANRLLRRKKLDEELGDRGHYKRFSGVNQYDVCDYRFLYYSKNEVLKYFEDRDPSRPKSRYQPFHRYYMK